MSEYQLTKKDILQIIENEIAWCKTHPDPDGSQQWNNGYVAGVTNVKYLIQKAEQTIKEGRDRFVKDVSKDNT